MAVISEALAGCPEKEAVLSWQAPYERNRHAVSAIRVDSGAWLALIMPLTPLGRMTEGLDTR